MYNNFSHMIHIKPWLAHAVLRQRDNESLLGPLYFQTHWLTLCNCSGSTENGMHYDLTTTASLHFFWQLSPNTYEDCEGKVAKWFRNKILPNPPAKPTTCWRSIDGKCFCEGSAHTLSLCIFLPIMLIIELGIYITDDDMAHGESVPWHFPQTLLPDTKDAAKEDGLIYDIVGCTFANQNHFVA
jgi:hypothetical protein